jgi:hypothetical protein
MRQYSAISSAFAVRITRSRVASRSFFTLGQQLGEALGEQISHGHLVGGPAV